MKVLHVAEPALHRLYGADVLLVRPDQHVAWRGAAPQNTSAATAVLRLATGW